MGFRLPFFRPKNSLFPPHFPSVNKYSDAIEKYKETIMYGSMRYLYSLVPKPNYKQIIIDQSYSIWLCIIKKRGLVTVTSDISLHMQWATHVRGHLSYTQFGHVSELCPNNVKFNFHYTYSESREFNFMVFSEH
jgi:hypothetical protein